VISMKLTEAGALIGASLRGGNAQFRGVSTDSRTVASGELFCALRGPRFDGHSHCAEAAARGAAAALVEREVDSPIPLLLVDDTRKALGRLAGAWRRRFSLAVVGVTGSNGKTTVKEMIASILRFEGNVLSTTGNLNNDIGVPKTLFQLDVGHDYAVVEMGANHVGEIAELTAMAVPEVGVITLCAPAHLEGFGTLERVAQAKGELYEGLAATGTAVINADDAFADYWTTLAGRRRIIRFGLDQPADIQARDIRTLGIGNGMAFTLQLPDTELEIELPLDGLHNVANALAAAAAAAALAVAPQNVKTGLENVRRVAGRLNVLRGEHGVRLIDDTYNANPTSLGAGLAVLSSAPGERWLVLGDMGELGPDAESMHRQAGCRARELGIERLFTFGTLARAAAEAFGTDARHFTDIDALNDALAEGLGEDVTVLIKGSRVMRMERVTAALRGAASLC